VASPGATPSTLPTTIDPTASPSSPSGSLDAVRATVLAQLDAGRLESDTADDLIDRLDEIEACLADGETDKAAEKAAELRRRLTELRKDRDLAVPGYKAIVASLDAAGLPTGDGRGND
jgi:hypothetical protein